MRINRLLVYLKLLNLPYESKSADCSSLIRPNLIIQYVPKPQQFPHYSVGFNISLFMLHNELLSQVLVWILWRGDLNMTNQTNKTNKLAQLDNIIIRLQEQGPVVQMLVGCIPQSFITRARYEYLTTHSIFLPRLTGIEQVSKKEEIAMYVGDSRFVGSYEGFLNRQTLLLLSALPLWILRLHYCGIWA